MKPSLLLLWQLMSSSLLLFTVCLSVYESGYLCLQWSNHKPNESQIAESFRSQFLTRGLLRDPDQFTEDHGSSPRGSRKFTEVHGSSRKFTVKFTEVHGSSLGSSQMFTVKLTEVYRTSPRIKDEIGICQD